MDCDIQISDKVICEYKTLAEFTTDTVPGSTEIAGGTQGDESPNRELASPIEI